MQTDVSRKAADIIMQSWSEGSIKQYNTYLRNWVELCRKWNTNPYDPPLTRVLDYLTSLFERGLRYDAINTAKSAISAITVPRNGVSLGSQPLLSRFMKGILKVDYLFHGMDQHGTSNLCYHTICPSDQ